MLIIRDYQTGKIIKGLEAVTRVVETTEITNEIVGQPLETGEQVFDHVVVNPDTFSLELSVSNTGEADKIELGQVARNVFGVLKKLRDDRKVLIVEGFHSNNEQVLVKQITFTHTAPYIGALTIRVDFQKLLAVKPLEKAKELETYTPKVDTNKKVDKTLKKTLKKTLSKSSQWSNKVSVLDKINNTIEGLSKAAEIPKTIIKKVADYPKKFLKTASGFSNMVGDWIDVGFAATGAVNQTISSAISIYSQGVNYIDTAFDVPNIFKVELEKNILQFELAYDKTAGCWKSSCVSLTENEQGETIETVVYSSRNIVPETNIFEGIDKQFGLVGLFMTNPPPDNRETQNGIECSVLALTKENCKIFYMTEQEVLDAYYLLKNYQGERDSIPVKVSCTDFNYKIKVV